MAPDFFTYRFPRLALLAAFLLCPLAVFPQEAPVKAKPKAKLALELGFAPMLYRGDLQGAYPKWGGGFMAALRNLGNSRLGSSLQLFYVAVSGQDLGFKATADEASANSFFKANIGGISGSLAFNFIKKERFTLYISQGLGIMVFTPRDLNANKFTDQYLSRLPDESYTGNTLQLPSALGGRVLFRNGMGVSFEAGSLNPMTDYLDNVSLMGLKKGNDRVFFGKLALLVPLSGKKLSGN